MTTREKPTAGDLKKGDSVEIMGYVHQRSSPERDGQTMTMQQIDATVIKPRTACSRHGVASRPHHILSLPVSRSCGHHTAPPCTRAVAAQATRSSSSLFPASDCR
jgi:hypothetical protein